MDSTAAPRTCVLVAQPCLRRPRVVVAAGPAEPAPRPPPLQQPRREDCREQEPSPASLPSAQPLTFDIPLLEGDGSEDGEGPQGGATNPG